MPFELRPTWCVADEEVKAVLDFGEWSDENGLSARSRDGDHWKPGDSIHLRRSVKLLADRLDVRRQLGLGPGAVIGISARWSCRSTATAGVHVGGPSPLDLLPETTLSVEIPSTIGGSIELETCLIVSWNDTDPPPLASCPDRALVWSDGWILSASDRELLLEGGQGRIPVRTASFKDYYGQASGALWAIDLDPAIEPEDLIANVVTVLLNEDVLQRDFSDGDATPDPARIPQSALAGIQVDLIRSLTASLHEELEDATDWIEYEVGTVGAMLASRLNEAFGSLVLAARNFEQDQSTFDRELWNRFAPGSWSSAR
jgi:hypothetical protein